MFMFAIWTTIIVSPLQPLNARAAPQPLAGEKSVAACIARSAAGRGWVEKTLWGLRDQEGGWVGAEVPNDDGSHDLGPLQVNSWWVPRLAMVTGKLEPQIRHWLTWDACFNVDAARWIFLSGFKTTRNYWKAVGLYHSPTAWRQRRHAHSVSTKLRRRYGPGIFAPSASTGR